MLASTNWCQSCSKIQAKRFFSVSLLAISHKTKVSVLALIATPHLLGKSVQLPVEFIQPASNNSFYFFIGATCFPFRLCWAAGSSVSASTGRDLFPFCFVFLNSHTKRKITVWIAIKAACRQTAVCNFTVKFSSHHIEWLKWSIVIGRITNNIRQPRSRGRHLERRCEYLRRAFTVSFSRAGITRFFEKWRQFWRRWTAELRLIAYWSGN